MKFENDLLLTYKERLTLQLALLYARILCTQYRIGTVLEKWDFPPLFCMYSTCE